MGFKMSFEPLRLTRIGEMVPVTLLFFFAVVIFTLILVNRTKFGRRIVAIGGNEQNARLSGINVDRYRIGAYMITGALCGLAAIIYASRVDSIKADSGTGYELRSLISAVIGGVTFDGGKGTISGAFLGALFYGLIENSMNLMKVNAHLQYSITGIIIVVAVIISNLDKIRQEFGR
jgi:ribose/xylose/arabinose/galactoside ABC-type transport system permease subunit